MGAPQAKNFHFPPPWGLPKLGNFHFSPPVGAPQAREFSLFPRVGAPQAREFSVGAPEAREFSLFPPVGAPQAREFSLFPPVWASAVTAFQAMEFSLFPPFKTLQAAEFQIARQRRLDSPPNPVFFECVSMFLQWFPSKHGTLHFCRHKTGRKHRSCSTMLPIPLSPQPLKIPLFTVFSSIFPCANAGSQLQHIYKKSFQNIVFDSVFSNVSSQTVGNLHVFCHKSSKSFQNIAFDSVFCNVSSQAYGNLHVFCYNVSPKHLFLQCFQCSGIQKPCKILLCTMFFSFLDVFHCRKATKMTQNSISIPSCVQTPKNPRKMSKTPPYSGLGAKPFLGPPQLKLI